MLRLEPAKMTKAIERAKREHYKVRIINASKREYAVGVYVVRFAVIDGERHGECNCKAGQLDMYCKHLVAGAQANIMVQSMREEGVMKDFIARNTGWML